MTIKKRKYCSSTIYNVVMNSSKRLNNVDKEKYTIGNLFDRIAPSYDTLNHLFSLGIDRGWRRKAVHCLNDNTREVLDVAAGTGDFSIALCKQEKARKVVGIDLSEGMLALGRKKVHEVGLSREITLQHCDVAEMPFDDNRFSAVTCAFGVRNFSRRKEGLDEMYRVLQEGGKLIILEFSYPKNKIVNLLYNWYFTKFMPVVGGWLSKDKKAYSYLPASVKSFPYGEPFVQELEEAGFVYIGQRQLSCGICTLYTAEKATLQALKVKKMD